MVDRQQRHRRHGLAVCACILIGSFPLLVMGFMVPRINSGGAVSHSQPSSSIIVVVDPYQQRRTSTRTTTTTTTIATAAASAATNRHSLFGTFTPSTVPWSSSATSVNTCLYLAKGTAAETDDDDDDDDIDTEDDVDDDWEAVEGDLLSELEDLGDLEEVTDDDEDDDDSTTAVSELDDEEIDYVDEEDDTTKIKATDDEYDEDEDELDGLDILEEEKDDTELDDGEEEWEDEEVEVAEEELRVGSTAAKLLARIDKSINEEDANDDEDDDPNLMNVVPLQDDPDDPNYNAQKKLVEETVARRERDRLEAQAAAENEDMEPRPILSQEDSEAVDFFMKEMQLDGEDELDEVIDMVDSEDVKRNLDLQSKMPEFEALSMKFADPSTNYSNWLKDLNEVEFNREFFDYELMPEEVEREINLTLSEIGGASYNVTNWLLYDLKFNVTNLILAAVQHNPGAPIIFQHWYPQLLIYERYQHARDRNFDFSWDDVNNADLTELERYYMGFGYDEIPGKAPEETGAIIFEEMDEEEIKMAAFEKWMLDVYNEEWDKKDFDDDSISDEDNVYSDDFKMPQHPDKPTWEDTQDDLEEWRKQFAEAEARGDEAAIEYRDYMGSSKAYKPHPDNETFEKEFRGHLIVACGDFDDDLDVAEMITTRFEEEFGPNQVYVETRVMSHARKDDNVFEIWLESYEIDLIHSRRRASMMAEGWDGPAEVDDKQLDYLVTEVRSLISDEARVSYRVMEADYST